MKRKIRVISANERSAEWEGNVIQVSKWTKGLTVPAAIADKFPAGARVKVRIELIGEE